MNTTRRHPRSMREAFKDADYASSIERFGKRHSDRAVSWTLTFAGVFIAVMLVAEKLMGVQ
jgi:hypothetical protein